MDTRPNITAEQSEPTAAVTDEFEFSPLATPDTTETDEKITIVGFLACR
jgi:hypothetical protein